VPTYTTNTERDHQHILDNSGASAVIVSTAKLARTLMPAVLRSNVKLVITMESLRVGQQGDVRVLDWDPLVTGGEAWVEETKARGLAMTRDDTACIIPVLPALEPRL
jgi:long-chain acyl-CoA synthetase